jgi:hypothetical protein
MLLMHTNGLFSQDFWHIRQVSNKLQDHEMDNNHNFSPDDQWIVYDTRPKPGGIGINDRIEKISSVTGKIKVIYQVTDPNKYGPGVGAVSYHPTENKVIFIHGLPPASKKRPYAMHRRLGRIVDESKEDTSYWMDSRDIVAPFVPGALRGGTHRHQWSGDGNWLGYTYNDAIMVSLEKETGEVHNLRTVGVSKRTGKSPEITSSEGENYQGEWYSVLVVSVVPDPKPGSNEISKAYSDWWIGKNGYQKEDGSRQRARAFLGDLLTEDGKEITEVFIVDIPENINIPGNTGPLEGTSTAMPSPPEGAITRRLTFTEGKRFPGVDKNIRHWVTSSADGEFISYLARDEKGITQVFVVPVNGGKTRQVSNHPAAVQGTVRWHPKIREFAYVSDNRIYVNGLDQEGNPGKAIPISPQYESAPFALNYSNDGEKIAFNKDVAGYTQIFIAERP